MPQHTGYLLIAHGSKLPAVREEVALLSKQIAEQLRNNAVKFAFLEILEPTIENAFENLINESGCNEIVVLLHFLNSGKHVLLDIPNHLSALKVKFPNTQIRMAGLLGSHPRLPELYFDIAQSCRPLKS